MWRSAMRSIIARRRRLLATCSAVLLGVAFLTGTLVLVRAVTTGFTDLVTTAYAGTDAVVRSSVLVGSGDSPEWGLIDLSLADTVVAVDGVAAAAPRIEGSGRIVGADGEQVGGSGPTVTGNWVDDDRLNPYDLDGGRMPGAPGEVVIDRAAADEGNLAVGDPTVVLTPDPIDVTVVGLATFGARTARARPHTPPSPSSSPPRSSCPSRVWRPASRLPQNRGSASRSSSAGSVPCCPMVSRRSPATRS